MLAKVAPRLQHALIVTVVNRTVPATGGFVVASPLYFNIVEFYLFIPVCRGSDLFRIPFRR